MRRLNLVLLATVQLCSARSPGFSIHEDLLAFPQYEVVFSDVVISQKEAQALLDSDVAHPTYSADFSHPTTGDASGASDGTGADSGFDANTEDEPGHTYELINMAPHRYLCTIPVIQAPGPENQTANELARAEEARELTRAAANGWELLTELEESCLYYMSGWWSYSFCNNRRIVQFHAVAAPPSGQPPRRDPHTAEYVLGRKPTLPAAADQRTWQDDAAAADEGPLPAEVHTKGGKRYLVQKLEDGTICDLTERPRTIEVQYHCVPGMKKNRIAWIKEVTICSYVMIVNSPRLCDDVAFLPPDEMMANPISCQLIAHDNMSPPLLDQELPIRGRAAAEAPLKASEEKLDPELAEAVLAAAEAAKKEQQPPLTIGGVVVGGRNVLSRADEAGKPPVQLKPPRSAGGIMTKGDRTQNSNVLAQGAAKDEGGEVTMLSTDELEKMELQPELIEEMQKRIQELAGEAGWKLEVVELPGGEFRELHGYIDGEEIKGDEEQGEAGGETKGDDPGGAYKKAAKDAGSAKKGGQDGGKRKNNEEIGSAEQKKGTEDEEQGSDEQFFRD